MNLDVFAACAATASYRNAAAYGIVPFIFSCSRIIGTAAHEVNRASVFFGFSPDVLDYIAGHSLAVIIYFFQSLVKLTNGHISQGGIGIRCISAPIAVHFSIFTLGSHQYFIICTENFACVYILTGCKEYTYRIIHHIQVIIGNNFPIIRIGAICV